MPDPGAGKTYRYRLPPLPVSAPWTSNVCSGGRRRGQFVHHRFG